MRHIVEANIHRFKELLGTETDLTKRAMIVRLLDEQEAMLEEVSAKPAKKAKAS